LGGHWKGYFEVQYFFPCTKQPVERANIAVQATLLIAFGSGPPAVGTSYFGSWWRLIASLDGSTIGGYLCVDIPRDIGKSHYGPTKLKARGSSTPSRQQDPQASSGLGEHSVRQWTWIRYP
jgi:hypothetical protein